jgi:hypothetical protein
VLFAGRVGKDADEGEAEIPAQTACAKGENYALRADAGNNVTVASDRRPKGNNLMMVMIIITIIS